MGAGHQPESGRKGQENTNGANVQITFNPVAAVIRVIVILTNGSDCISQVDIEHFKERYAKLMP